MAQTAKPYVMADDRDFAQQLASVPAYPSTPNLGSSSRPTVTSSAPTSPASAETSIKVTPIKDGTIGPTDEPKRKTIGSKILSKLKPSHSSGRDANNEADRSLSEASGTDDYDDFVAASKLRDSLQQENISDRQQQSFGSEDGIRQRQTFRDVTGHDGRDLTPSRHRQDSDASRHFPGDIFRERLRVPRGRLTKSAITEARSDEDHLKDLSDLDEDDPTFDDMIHHARRNSSDSDASDDTLTHLIREAEGYDALRHSNKGELTSRIDFDNLDAVRESEAQSDQRSSHSSYSGGASKALSKPLLELEDIELERFLKTFARHTRHATVTHSSDKQSRRMPQWSDFRLSVPESPNGEAQTQRPSMLARVDRGLKHFSDSLQSSAANTSTVNAAQRRSQPTSTLNHNDGDVSGHSDDETSQSLQRKSSKTVKKTKDTKSKSKKKKKNGADSNEQDWDIVPDTTSGLVNSSSPDDLNVSAQDEGVDGVAFCIAYILAFVEMLAPEEIDHHPDRSYREGLIRSHLERLYTIAPFWEQLGFRIRRLYRWEEPKTTAAAAMVYFVLWYTDMIPTAFLLTIMFYIMRFKYFPPSESYLHDKVKQRMARGQAANTLSDKLRKRSRLDILTIYKRWANAYGAQTQEAMGVIADFHEKVKNLILWRNPAATRRTLILFGALNLFVTFTPAHYVYKTAFFGLGITFFCLLPLQSYFPSHRKALSPLWWATFGAPTDAQFAVQILRKRHLDYDKFVGQSNTAEEVRKAAQGNGNSRSKPRADRREDGLQWDQLEDSSRAGQDYVETSKDASYKPRKLGSYFCQYKGLPGRLHINTKFLYFTPLHSPAQKRGHTPLEAIDSLVKTKNIRLGLWNSLGLKITRNNGNAPMLLANVQHRDDAFNLVLAVSTSAD